MTVKAPCEMCGVSYERPRSNSRNCPDCRHLLRGPSDPYLPALKRVWAIADDMDDYRTSREKLEAIGRIVRVAGL